MLECFGRRDIGLGGALANDQPDAGAGNHSHVTHRSFAALRTAIDALSGDYDDIGGFTILYTLYDPGEGVERNYQLVSARVLKLRREIVEDSHHSKGAQYLYLDSFGDHSARHRTNHH